MKRLGDEFHFFLLSHRDGIRYCRLDQSQIRRPVTQRVPEAQKSLQNSPQADAAKPSRPLPFLNMSRTGGWQALFISLAKTTANEPHLPSRRAYHSVGGPGMFSSPSSPQRSEAQDSPSPTTLLNVANVSLQSGTSALSYSQVKTVKLQLIIHEAMLPNNRLFDKKASTSIFVGNTA
ncbi:hypothetical protein AC578_1943 [Pseudocercospora eumusae]|uniref:Uncharacterized protein n=1 Tax=Pseudocercospora eumusae TaxID=321146 RepID=A0A139HDA7_9PEZI|nr:hypothetical protein AC578_1943 [Pseudocercospora eumusae]